MSVIVKSIDDDKYYLLTKGADSGMIPNLELDIDELAKLEE